MEFQSVALRRHSTREFRSTKIPNSELENIINIGCAAPVSMSAFDSLLIAVISCKNTLDKISNVVALMHNDLGYDIFYGAPVAVIIFSKNPIFEGLDYSNGACIAQNMLLAATDLGIDSIYLYGPSIAFRENESLYELTKIPKSYHPVAAVALGYSAKPSPPIKELEPTIKIKYI